MNLKRAGTKKESPEGTTYRFPLLMKTIMSIPNTKPYVQWSPIKHTLMGVVVSEDVAIQISVGSRAIEVFMGFFADHSMKRLQGVDDVVFDRTPEHIEANQEVVFGENKNFKWRGPMVNGQPYGFGSLFDNNCLCYRGFFCGECKVCYGVMYYKDGKSPCYRGGYWYGKELGYGTGFNKNGSVIQETYITSKEENSPFEPIHSLLPILMIPLTVVKIRDDKDTYALQEFLNCDADFVMGSWMTNLKHLLIDIRMMRMSKRFELVGLPSLESLVVGDFAFTKRIEGEPPSERGGSFVVTDCPSLQVMGFGKFAFADFTSIKLQRLPLLSRIGFSQSTFEYCSALDLRGMRSVV